MDHRRDQGIRIHVLRPELLDASPLFLNPQEAGPPPVQGLRIPLGKNCDTKKDVYWDPFTQMPKKLANQHVLIVGKSGAGRKHRVEKRPGGHVRIGHVLPGYSQSALRRPVVMHVPHPREV